MIIDKRIFNNVDGGYIEYNIFQNYFFSYYNIYFKYKLYKTHNNKNKVYKLYKNI